MNLNQILKYVLAHPLNRGNRLAALSRFFLWQLRSRLHSGDVVHQWVNDSQIYAKSGESGVTGNIYCGLHEFPDMAFLLHVLRPDDCFIDVGANVGSYTVLASSAIGARTICFEPVPSTYQRLKANIRLNAMEGRVSAYNYGLGESETTIRFSSDQNCMNHVIAATEEASASVDVKVTSLDLTLSESPFLIKIDVEGYELPILRGAKNILRDERLNAVILELNNSGARYGFKDQQIVDLLTEFGFRAYQYQPFERTLSLLDGKNQTSGNTLFLRDFELVYDRIQNADKVRIHGCEF